MTTEPADMLIRFSPQDTFFFREARPMEAQGVKPLAGQFPPPARTMAGAVRSLLGEAMGVDWEAYRRDADRTAHAAVDALIGPPDADPPGPLQLRGPFPIRCGQRLFPAPLHLLRAMPVDDGSVHYHRLQPGKQAVECDLGKVYLPALASGVHGAKPCEDVWLDAADFGRVLAGNDPVDPIPLVGSKGLLVQESRLGIGLDQSRRSASDGLLYQTVHVRPHPDTGVGVALRGGVPEPLPPLGKTVRMGGEGRFAHVSAGPAKEALLPPLAKPSRPPAGVLLSLLAPASMGGTGWVPPGFVATQDASGAQVWRGTIAGIALELVCAVLGRAVREGGWDMRAAAPRAAESLIPAGSVFFFRCTDPVAAAAALHGQFIGCATELGRGEVAAGFWF